MIRTNRGETEVRVKINKYAVDEETKRKTLQKERQVVEVEIIEELLKINELQNDIIVKERQKQQLKYFLKPE